MRLISVYDIPEADAVLYELLAERPRENFISHERLPTFREHQAFIASHPFMLWLLIESDGVYLGAIEVTDRNEIGIAILRRYQGKGCGKEALSLFLDSYSPLPAIPAIRNGRWLVNVAPSNMQAQSFFLGFGFKTIQLTMALPNG